MGHVAVSNQVIARNEFGRFIKECEQAGRYTIAEAVKEGEKLSRQKAPSSGKRDPRSVSIKAGMYSVVKGTKGWWGTHARHGLAVEKGAVRHMIYGNPNLGFFWEKMDRDWIPAEVYYNQPGLRDSVDHPATRAQPYLKPAYDVVMGKVMDIARKYYPG